jgi:hypothetical protein
MAVTLTTEQILALAPDAGAAKNGQSLAAARHWVTLGGDGLAVWGECQGSGAKPYQTQIDLTELSFRCSCPSRKFPCKHGLGLLLLRAAQPAIFKQKSQPVWVSEWLDARTKRAEQRADRAAKQSEEIADPAAQARHADQREKKVAAGLNELELWLRDQARGGLINAKSELHSIIEQPARRMTDAQAPGVARLLRELSGLLPSDEAFEAKLLERLSRLWLLIESYRRIESLPPETQSDIRALIGWTQNQDELLAQSGIRDRWLVMGQRVEEEDRLRRQSSWLRGSAGNRHALILNFAHASQPLDTSIVPGAMLDAELVFYPGAYPMRALIRERHSVIASFDTQPCNPTIAAAIESYAAALSRNPWIERFPFALHSVTPLRADEDRWMARDSDGQALPVIPRYSRGWELLALSGGHPVELFGEWNGDHLAPLSVWADGRFVRLS